MKRILILITCLIFVMSAFSESPKRELRSTWIASVSRIDWPKSSIESNQKNELIKILDGLEAANMTSAFLQVRPMCDAFYNSKYEPWSQYLTGTRGKDPGYDPLAFAIEEAHKRGIELHAWLNPYRYETSGVTHASSDYIKANHPNWLLKYNEVTILDPGNPEVRTYIIDVVKDIVENYNVDGIVFDDYFYPYEGTSNQDAYSQALYKPQTQNVGDWRRENVNIFIADTYKMIQETKETVKFGVGPFGIWGANQAVANEYGIEYLNTSGATNPYNSIYCDPIKWMKEKNVDYITPQCYWPSTNTASWGYSTLVPWWSRVSNTLGRHFYSSMRISTMGTLKSGNALKSAYASYNVTEQEVAGFSQLERAILQTTALATDECGYEVDLNRSTDLQGAPGHVFFNTTQFFSYKLDVYLRDNKFTEPALTPVMTWKTPLAQAIVSNLSLDVDKKELTWDAESTETDRFAVYLIPNVEIGSDESFKSSKYIKKITWNKSLDVSLYESQFDTHTFAITAVDAHGYETLPYVAVSIEQSENTSFKAVGGKGVIDISTEIPRIVNIYSLAGQLLYSDKIDSNTTVPMSSGLYIINNQKVVVW